MLPYRKHEREVDVAIVTASSQSRGSASFTHSALDVFSLSSGVPEGCDPCISHLMLCDRREGLLSQERYEQQVRGSA